MAVPVKKIRRFLESTLAQHDSVNIYLYVVNVTGRKSTISVYKHGKWSLDDTPSEISEQAQSNTDGAGSVQKFALFAYRTDDTDKEEPVNSTSFAVSPETMGESDSALSEPATNEGLLAMLMRHNSDLHRQSAGTWGLMFQYLTRIIENNQTQIEKLTTEKLTQAAAVEDLVSRKHERDLEMEDKKSKQRRLDDMMGKVLSLLPVAINKLAGKEIVRQNDTLFEVTSAEFLSTLTPGKLDAMMDSGILDKHQLTLLVTMLEQQTKRMVAADDKAKQKETAEKAATNNLGPLSALSGLISFGNAAK